MKKLVLGNHLRKKLARLPEAAGDLSFLGIDLNRLLERPVIAIVGSRRPTPYGKQVTEKLAGELARAGSVIVSGLAYGVDITAHKAVLAAGGMTIAVLPSGLDTIYPAAHAQIAEQIAEQGSVISEYEAGHKPWKAEFLERNRLIAALSDAVIITEAAEKSGSLNTAAHAKSMDIPVFAVPGPITNPMSSGSNALLKRGARVLTSTDDVLDLLGVDRKKPSRVLNGRSEEETLILRAIAGGISDTEILRQEVQIQTADLQTILTMLEIAGRIKQDSIGAWHLA